MKIGTKKQEIYNLLVNDAKLRDNDNLLICIIWRKEIAKLQNFDYESLSAKDLLCIISCDTLTSPEGITRCRRKIQQENPSLRGRKYILRLQQQTEVKTEIKNWNNEN